MKISFIISGRLEAPRMLILQDYLVPEFQIANSTMNSVD